MLCVTHIKFSALNSRRFCYFLPSTALNLFLIYALAPIKLLLRSAFTTICSSNFLLNVECELFVLYLSGRWGRVRGWCERGHRSIVDCRLFEMIKFWLLLIFEFNLQRWSWSLKAHDLLMTNIPSAARTLRRYMRKFKIFYKKSALLAPHRAIGHDGTFHSPPSEFCVKA